MTTKTERNELVGSLPTVSALPGGWPDCVDLMIGGSHNPEGQS